MAKIILKEITDGFVYRTGVETTLIRDHVDDLDGMLEIFHQFLICCGYSVNGTLEIVEEDEGVRKGEEL